MVEEGKVVYIPSSIHLIFPVSPPPRLGPTLSPSQVPARLAEAEHIPQDLLQVADTYSCPVDGYRRLTGLKLGLLAAEGVRIST